MAWLFCLYKQDSVHLRDFESYLNHLGTIQSKSGWLEMISYHKRVRQSVINYLSGSELRPARIGFTKDRLPRCLGPSILATVRSKTPGVSLRLVLSLLFCTRALILPPAPDIKPIVEPYNGKVPPYFEFNLVREFWKGLGKVPLDRVPRRLRFKKFHFSTRKGPNGPALTSWYDDLVSLPKELIHSISVCGGQVISDAMQTALWFEGRFDFVASKPHSQLKFRKITYFSDKEGKTRVIAIGDYFSQTVLLLLHRYLFGILKLIPQDCTFDQDKFRSLLLGQEIYYSVDLTNATDRFPLTLIASLLKGHLPTRYVDSWVSIMSGFPFQFKEKGKDPIEVTYTVGNPMGFYSSWGSFALCHHFIVYLACREVSVSWRNLPYALLGDDIVIANQKVGEAYLQLLHKYGVGVSELKTHKSPHLYEFAKRWVYKDVEVTPFPFSAVKESSKRTYLLATLLYTLNLRGWDFDIAEAICLFYSIVCHLPRRFRREMGKQSIVTIHSLNFSNGFTTAGEFINHLGSVLRWPSSFDDIVAQHLISSVLVDLYRRSLQPRPGTKPLGKTVVDSLEDVLTLEVIHASNLHTVPIESEFLRDKLLLWRRQYGLGSPVQGPMTDAFLEFSNKFLEMSKLVPYGPIDVRSWPAKLKSAGIPKDDGVFSNDDTNVTSVVLSMLCSRLLSYLDNLRKR